MKAALTYHSIDDSGSAISVRRDAFSRHLEWLTSGRVRTLSLGELTAYPQDGGDAVAITFDDGLQNAREPMERLLGCGVPVSVFVVTGRVGGTNAWNGTPQRGIPTLPLLTWAQLEALIRRGLAVEAHSRTHANLTTLSAAALNDELGGCQDELRARLGARSTHIAYPFGAVDAAVERCAAAFFRHGHTTEFRCLSNADAPLTLPRLDMYYLHAPGALESFGTPAFGRRVRRIALRRKLRRFAAGA